jgi:magnesium-transporting ATPase (P-type)
LTPLALAVRTGYTSRRGRIIRKILHKNPKEPQFFKTFIYFLTETYLVGGIAIYFATLKFYIDAEIETAMIVLLFFLYITFCYPPAFPIYFNLAYSYSLARLKFKNIHGTEP